MANCGCPEGYQFNEKTGLCESTDSVEAVWTGATIPIIKGCINTNYSAKGLRLYQDITNYTLPIVTPSNPFGNGTWQFGPTNPYGFPNQVSTWSTNDCGPLPAGSDPNEWLRSTSSCFTAQNNPNDLFINTRNSDFWLHDSSGLNTPLEILVGEASADNPANLTGIGQPVFRSSLWGIDYDISPPINCIDPGITGAQYNGRLNNAGIWSDPNNTGADSCSTSAFVDTGVSFDFCVNLEESKQYLIGLAGDNTARIYIDGNLVVDIDTDNNVTATFRYWHVFPITLTAGQHIITLEGYNRRAVATFAGEIYDITLQEFQNLLLVPANSGDPSFPDSATCGNVYEDLEPYIIFTTQSYIDSGIPDLTDTEGEWLCGEEVVGDDVCGTTPLCSTTVTTEPFECCYLIDACDNGEPPFEISLADTETTELVVGNVYSFSDPGNVLDNLGCFTVVEVIPCDSPVFIDVTVAEDHQSTECDVCIPCYELTDCEDPENTVIIKWDPEAAPLEQGTSYVFTFDTTKCWSAELQFSPCQGTQYTTENIVASYVDCDECIKPCYKLIDCEEGYPTISTENTVFEVYVGKVIQWQDQLGEDHCATVEKYICKDETWPEEPIVVLDCFDTCEECLPQPVPQPIFELSSRSVRPGYNTPGCPPEYYEKVKCKFSEVVYQEMLSKRFGIETCCDIDERKYDIKHELLKLDALEDPYLCNPICATYSFSVYINAGDAVEVQYVDCDGVEQTISVINFEGIYAPEICALTTFTPVITITRVDSSVEQYKFETSYHICCPVVPEYFFYEFRIEQPFGYDSVVINYRNQAGEDQAVTVPGCVPSKDPCPGVGLEFCAEYGSITIDTFGTGIVYATNEDCLFGSGCVQDPRLTRLGDCP